MSHAARPFPGGARFAFTIVDDTDLATVANVKPVYDLLAEVGMCTTKTLWTLPATESNPYDGTQTADQPDYRAFLQDIQRDGFELAMHGVRAHSSVRADVLDGIARFDEWFGPPRMHINHFNNADNVYWADARLSGFVPRLAYRLAAKTPPALGHVEGSDYFWGDVCRHRIDWVRSFTVRRTNLVGMRTPLAYSDPERPFVRAFFLSSEGGTLEDFCARITETEQDALAAGGYCVMYTHFGDRFCVDGELNPEFERLMRRLAALEGGWFPTASELLDHLYPSTPDPITRRERAAIERNWLSERLRHGSS
jgi:hypothetical protein